MTPEETKRKIVELKRKPEFGKNVIPPKNEEEYSYHSSSSSDEDEDEKKSEGIFSPSKSGEAITHAREPLEVSKPGRDKISSTSTVDRRVIPEKKDQLLKEVEIYTVPESERFRWMYFCEIPHSVHDYNEKKKFGQDLGTL